MMESATALRSFNYSVGAVSPLCSAVERPSLVFTHNAVWHASTKRVGALLSCAKTSDAAIVDKSNGSLEKKTSRGSTFPSGFEELVMGVCDETQIAELKMKIGDFEMHLKRKTKSTEPPTPIAPPTEPPPVPTKPMAESPPAAPPSPPEPSSVKANEFTNVPVEKSKKLEALEASGATGYILVSSPTVGWFRKGRSLKEKKQPPVCNEGDVIKEGQIICYIDQFGTELPVKSDARGEVIKILFDDGEAVGFGDPLIAVK